MGTDAINDRKVSKLQPQKNGEPYYENPQQEQLDMVPRNYSMFMRSGKILWTHPRAMYTFIKDFCREHVLKHPQYPKYIWKPKICDVGCGLGFGANILSQEGDFVWAIDKNPQNVAFAKECFERQKNNIYYTPQLTFDEIDLENQPREMMMFDIVSCIEVIEHVDNYQMVLDFTKRLCKKDKKGQYRVPGDGSTKVFFSTPNRDDPGLDRPFPKNKFHIREWRIGEFYDLLTKNFKHVTIMDYKGKPIDLDYKGAIIFAMCEVPIDHEEKA